MSTDNQRPIDYKEGEIDNTVGHFIFDHEKETEVYVPNENFGKPVVSELDQAKAQIAQLEERLKEATIIHEKAANSAEQRIADLLASNKEYRKMLFEVSEFLESKDYLAFAEDIEALLKKYSDPSKPTQQ